MDEQVYAIWLSEVLGTECAIANYLRYTEKTPVDFYVMNEEQLDEYLFLSEEEKQKLLDKDLTKAEEIWSDCKKKGISVLTLLERKDCRKYPMNLLNIARPPLILYYIGTVPEPKQYCIGMVGTRKLSRYGVDMGYSYAYKLSKAGFNIVSGMAQGTDGICASGALANNSATYAVLGCGVDICYPKQHKPLRDAIICSGGGILSEYPPGTPPKAYNFPQRNRIISGLSKAVIVVESGESGGSLITANYALKQKRILFAIPRDLDDTEHQGANQLISQGATPLVDMDDIFDIVGTEEEYRCKVGRKMLEGIPTVVPADYGFLAELGVMELNDDAVSKEKPSAPPLKKTTSEKSSHKTTKTATVKDKPKETVLQPTPVAEPKPIPQNLSETAMEILKAMPDNELITLENLCRESGIPVNVLECELLELEMDDIVEQLAGKQYRKR